VSGRGPLADRVPTVLSRTVFALADDNVWCPSPLRDRQGKYHLFFSRWPKSRSHEAWVTDSRVSHAEADSPLGPWRVCGDILPPRPEPEAWDADVTHNPHLIEAAGRYYLYYTGTRGSGFWKDAPERPSMEHPEWWVNRNNQRVGVVWADQLQGPWHRAEHPLMDPPPGYRTTGTPFVLARPDGRWQMVFKGVTEDGTQRGGAVRHFVALGEHPLGPFQTLPDPLLAGARTAFPIDDHCQWFEDGAYWCLAKDNGENIAGYSPCLILLHSADGLKWRPFEPHFTIPFTISWADGGSTAYERLEMPKFLFSAGRPEVLYLGALPLGEDESYCAMVPLNP
jgi:hypothetical protein